MRHTNDTIDALVAPRNIKRVTDFTTIKHKLLWSCGKGHTWSASPDSIIHKHSGCPECAGNKPLTNGVFDDAIKHTSVSRVGEIVSNNTPVAVVCRVCNHQWNARPAKMMHQHTGCPGCANRIRLTNSDVDKRCEQLGILRMADYKNIHTKIKWQCIKCAGVWVAKPSNVLHEHTGCPHCRTPQYSKIAIKWLIEISTKTGDVIQHAGNGTEFKIPGTRYKCDGYCKETNTVYEFYGDMWHGNPAVYSPDDFCSPFHKETAGELYTRTMVREQLIKQLGYNIVSIWEKEYNDTKETSGLFREDISN